MWPVGEPTEIADWFICLLGCSLEWNYQARGTCPHAKVTMPISGGESVSPRPRGPSAPSAQTGALRRLRRPADLPSLGNCCASSLIGLVHVR